MTLSQTFCDTCKIWTDEGAVTPLSPPLSLCPSLAFSVLCPSLAFSVTLWVLPSLSIPSFGHLRNINHTQVGPGDHLCDVETDKATMGWESQEEVCVLSVFVCVTEVCVECVCVCVC